MTEVTIRGDRELRRKLRKLKPDQLQGGLKAMGLTLSGKMKKYPPTPPASTYRRTRNLGKRWDIDVRRDSVKVFNIAEYAPYVQGDQDQAWFHRRTGWQRLKETAKKEMGEIVKALKKQVDRILRTG